MIRKSTCPGTAQRVGGWCEADAGAGTEWAWELRSEPVKRSNVRTFNW